MNTLCVSFTFSNEFGPVALVFALTQLSIVPSLVKSHLLDIIEASFFNWDTNSNRSCRNVYLQIYTEV